MLIAMVVKDVVHPLFGLIWLKKGSHFHPLKKNVRQLQRLLRKLYLVKSLWKKLEFSCSFKSLSSVLWEQSNKQKRTVIVKRLSALTHVVILIENGKVYYL
jgi:hypothetical protein